jgi:hypothetical protein
MKPGEYYPSGSRPGATPARAPSGCGLAAAEEGLGFAMSRLLPITAFSSGSRSTTRPMRIARSGGETNLRTLTSSASVKQSRSMLGAIARVKNSLLEATS